MWLWLNLRGTWVCVPARRPLVRVVGHPTNMWTGIDGFYFYYVWNSWILELELTNFVYITFWSCIVNRFEFRWFYLNGIGSLPLYHRCFQFLLRFYSIIIIHSLSPVLSHFSYFLTQQVRRDYDGDRIKVRAWNFGVFKTSNITF